MEYTTWKNIRKYLNQYDKAYENIINGIVSEEDEDILWNYELYLAKAIINEFSMYPMGSDNPAVKIAKIILITNSEETK